MLWKAFETICNFYYFVKSYLPSVPAPTNKLHSYMFFLWFWVHVGAFVCFIWPTNVWDQLKEMETAPVVCVRWFLCSRFLCLVDDFDEANWLKSLVCGRFMSGAVRLASFKHWFYVSLIKCWLPIACASHTLWDALNFFSVLYFCSCSF